MLQMAVKALIDQNVYQFENREIIKRRIKMRKLPILGFLCLLLIGTTFANQDKKSMGFMPLFWSSTHSKDVVNIQGGSGFGTYYLVQIYVNNMYNGSTNHLAGINIKNCGNVSHVSPGSTAVCTLSYTNPTISFSSDDDHAPAYGLYQISDH